MSLLTIAEGLAKNVGLSVPEQVISSPKREWVEAVALSNLVGEELARRVSWGTLNSIVTVTGNGTDAEFSIGATTSRINEGIAVTTISGTARPLSRAEWNGLPASVGTPRYFLLEGTNIRFWPHLTNNEAVSVSTQSAAWCDNGTAEWADDTDTSLIDEDLHLKGLIVRWRRQKGMDYADYEAEFEADLRDIADFDDRSRI